MNSYLDTYALGTPPPSLEDLPGYRPRRKTKSTSRKSRTRTAKGRWASLLEEARHSAAKSRSEGVRFMQTVVELAENGKVALLPREVGDSSGDTDSEVIGWIDSNALYLIPGTSVEAVREHLEEKGEAFDIKQDQLRSDLIRLGALSGDKGRTSASVRVGGRGRKLLRIPRAAVERLLRQG